MALACFQDVRFFVCSVSVLLFVDMIAAVYFRSTLTTIERRFELSTTLVAMLSTSYQIGNLAVMSFVSFYGSRTNRPRFIGIGSSLVAIGFLIASLPQFFDSRYEYIDTLKNSTSAASKQVEMCEINSTKTIGDVSCDMTEDVKPDNILYIFILVGLVFAGVGAAPLQPLGMSYIDDYSPRRKSPVYIGVVMTIALIGPAFGFLLGALILTLWVDFAWVDVDEVTIEPRNPNWVGAWWLGFLLSGILIAIATIPFYFFPKKLKKPDEDKNLKNENSLITSSSKDDEAGEKGGFLEALKRIFTNGVFLLLMLLWVFNGIKVVGVITFFPKFLEVQFGVSASKANMYFGAIGIPCLALGTLFGSYVMKRHNPNRVGMLKIILVSNIFTAVLTFPMLLLGCDTADIAGVTIPYTDSVGDQSEAFSTYPISECNSGCGCTEGTFSPICGSDGITYISPCHAGCNGTFSSLSGAIQNYTGCRCVNPQNDDILDSEHWSYPHPCGLSKCPHLVLAVLVLIAATNLFGGISATPSYMILMRTVSPKDKAFAIGVAIMITRSLAWIPGPLIYGKAIDSTCLYWAKSSCSGKGYCRVYDSTAYRTSFYSIVFAAEIVTACCALTLYIIVKKMYHKENGRYDDNDNKKQKEDEILLTAPNSSFRIAARLASESFSCSTDEIDKNGTEKVPETKETEVFT